MASGGFKMRVEVSGTCPCGKAFHAGYANTHPSAPPIFQQPTVDNSCSVPCVMHEEPHCRDFLERDVVEYLAWTRGVRRPLPPVTAQTPRTN